MESLKISKDTGHLYPEIKEKLSHGDVDGALRIVKSLWHEGLTIEAGECAIPILEAIKSVCFSSIQEQSDFSVLIIDRDFETLVSFLDVASSLRTYLPAESEEIKTFIEDCTGKLLQWALEKPDPKKSRYAEKIRLLLERL